MSSSSSVGSGHGPAASQAMSAAVVRGSYAHSDVPQVQAVPSQRHHHGRINSDRGYPAYTGYEPGPADMPRHNHGQAPYESYPHHGAADWRVAEERQGVPHPTGSYPPQPPAQQPGQYSSQPSYSHHHPSYLQSHSMHPHQQTYDCCSDHRCEHTQRVEPLSYPPDRIDSRSHPRHDPYAWQHTHPHHHSHHESRYPPPPQPPISHGAPPPPHHRRPDSPPRIHPDYPSYAVPPRLPRRDDPSSTLERIEKIMLAIVDENRALRATMQQWMESQSGRMVTSDTQSPPSSGTGEALPPLSKTGGLVAAISQPHKVRPPPIHTMTPPASTDASMIRSASGASGASIPSPSYSNTSYQLELPPPRHLSRQQLEHESFHSQQNHPSNRHQRQPTTNHDMSTLPPSTTSPITTPLSSGVLGKRKERQDDEAVERLTENRRIVIESWDTPDPEHSDPFVTNSRRLAETPPLPRATSVSSSVAAVPRSSSSSSSCAAPPMPRSSSTASSSTTMLPFSVSTSSSEFPTSQRNHSVSLPQASDSAPPRPIDQELPRVVAPLPVQQPHAPLIETDVASLKKSSDTPPSLGGPTLPSAPSEHLAPPSTIGDPAAMFSFRRLLLDSSDSGGRPEKRNLAEGPHDDTDSSRNNPCRGSSDGPPSTVRPEADAARGASKPIGDDITSPCDSSVPLRQNVGGPNEQIRTSSSLPRSPTTRPTGSLLSQQQRGGGIAAQILGSRGAPAWQKQPRSPRRHVGVGGLAGDATASSRPVSLGPDLLAGPWETTSGLAGDVPAPRAKSLADRSPARQAGSSRASDVLATRSASSLDESLPSGEQNASAGISGHSSAPTLSQEPKVTTPESLTTPAREESTAVAASNGGLEGTDSRSSSNDESSNADLIELLNQCEPPATNLNFLPAEPVGGDEDDLFALLVNEAVSSEIVNTQANPSVSNVQQPQPGAVLGVPSGHPKSGFASIGMPGVPVGGVPMSASNATAWNGLGAPPLLPGSQPALGFPLGTTEKSGAGATSVLGSLGSQLDPYLSMALNFNGDMGLDAVGGFPPPLNLHDDSTMERPTLVKDGMDAHTSNEISPGADLPRKRGRPRNPKSTTGSERPGESPSIGEGRKPRQNKRLATIALQLKAIQNRRLPATNISLSPPSSTKRKRVQEQPSRAQNIDESGTDDGLAAGAGGINEIIIDKCQEQQQKPKKQRAAKDDYPQQLMKMHARAVYDSVLGVEPANLANAVRANPDRFFFKEFEVIWSASVHAWTTMKTSQYIKSVMDSDEAEEGEVSSNGGAEDMFHGFPMYRHLPDMERQWILFLALWAKDHEMPVAIDKIFVRIADTIMKNLVDVSSQCRMVRAHSTLCRIMGDKKRARIFFWDVLRELPFDRRVKSVHYADCYMTCWPEPITSTKGLLNRAARCVVRHTLSSNTQVMSKLKSIMQWATADGSDSASLEEVTGELVLQFFETADEPCPVVQDEEPPFQFEMALTLLIYSQSPDNALSLFEELATIIEEDPIKVAKLLGSIVRPPKGTTVRVLHSDYIVKLLVQILRSYDGQIAGMSPNTLIVANALKNANSRAANDALKEWCDFAKSRGVTLQNVF